ncbi:IclR family transcriptional regulator [Streptomyces sp. NPDC049555]|uniref:IclR family transcriptional regulator n=1 Tax=Streptomyces sp. NPDC049555 TaxID=3154930 RepID=UPI00343F8C71
MYRTRALVGRTAAVLRLLEQYADDGVTGRFVTSTLNLPARTVLDLLLSLEAEGLIRRDPRSGAFRPARPAYAAAPAADCNDLRSCAMNWADRLAAHSGMSVRLAVPHPAGAQVVHHVFRPDNSPQHLATGRLCPPGGALARALAAPHDGRYVYAVEPGDPGEASLATALPCPGPEPAAAALCVTGARRTLSAQTPGSGRYRTLLREAATAIRTELGTPPVPRPA